MTTLNAAAEAWRTYSTSRYQDDMQSRYGERWQIYAGNAYTDPMMRDLRRLSPAIYQNTSLLWKHSKGVVGFYAAHVYQGGISTDGEPLEDGTLGAIPIMPQVQTDEQKAALRTAFGELAGKWNWQQKKSQRPKMGAILGDVMTELIDDPVRKAPYPRLVWPGYVSSIELDDVDNVLAYTLDYSITEEHDDGHTETYRYRKEVDKETFRFYKDDKPFGYPENDGLAVVDNPYEFVPAIWDRHETGWDERGIAATDSTRQALHMINSFLSHGIDHQRKVFFAPILVKGKVVRPGTTGIDLSRAPRVVSNMLGNDSSYSKPGNIFAETFDILPAASDAGLESMQFDVGQTLAFIEMLKEGVLSEEPEGTFYQQLRSMGEVTAPGAERLLGDSASKLREVRAGYDTQTVKLFQMAMSMAGMRVNNGEWGRGAELTRFHQAFRPFTLDSFHNGEMDFTIGDRPVIIPTEMERLDAVSRKEGLQTLWAMKKAGIPEKEAKDIVSQRNERYAVAVNSGAFGEDYEEAE